MPLFGSGQSSSCVVIPSPPTYTYNYKITVTQRNGVTTHDDPHVIIKGGFRHRHYHHRMKKAAPAQ